MGKRKVNEWMSEWVNEWMSEWVNEWMSEWGVKKRLADFPKKTIAAGGTINSANTF